MEFEPVIFTFKTIVKDIADMSRVFSDFKSTVTLDLTHIDYIDSAGIALLLELDNIAKTKKSRVVFSGTNSKIDRLCELYQIKL